MYFVNPASETGQTTFLRIVNNTATGGSVSPSAIDDNGNPGESAISFTLGPNESKQMTSTDLENGNSGKGLSGSFGDGTGKWRLTVSSALDLNVMSQLLHTTAMHLLQSGVDITVIALWLGHEDPATTHLYIEADLTMKEAALKRVDDLAPRSVQFKASNPSSHSSSPLCGEIVTRIVHGYVARPQNSA